MKLSVKDRLLFETLYPKQSDLMTQQLIKDIKEKVDFTKKEREALKFKEINGIIEWDKKANKEKEVDFSKAELRILKDQVDRLDNEKKITLMLVELCEKIKDA